MGRQACIRRAVCLDFLMHNDEGTLLCLLAMQFRMHHLARVMAGLCCRLHPM